MPSSSAAWTAGLFAGLTVALPSITFPINSQVPPVARIGEPFSFVFSPSTFSSDSALTYALANAPSWLSIDSKERRLFGTPNNENVGPGEVEGVLLNLVATDQSGSTTHTATLVVSRNKGPKLQVPLEKQIPKFGVFSGPSSLLALPDVPFSFDLKQDTFSNPSSSPLGYYAVMADNTPLPAWISFDPGRLSFSGRTPPLESLIQPPQRFPLKLVASDVVGFSGAGLGIDIVVGTHQITAEETTILLTGNPGKHLSYTKLKDSVRVDGKPVASDNVVLASTSNVPPWLSVDKNTWHITGTPPEDASSTNFTVQLQDSFADSLNLTVVVDVANEASLKAGGLFKGDALPTLTATAGKHFSFDLGPYFTNPNDMEITVSTLPSTSWVHFDADSLVLSGDVPAAPKDSVVGVRVDAKTKSSNRSGSLSLLLRVAAVGSNSGGSATQSPEATSTDAGASLAGDNAEKGPVNGMLVAVLLPLSVILLAAICFLFRCYRQRKQTQGRGISIRDISGPLPGTFEIKSPAPSTPPSLPAFDRHFDKSFSVNDVFVSEKKNPMERRGVRPGRPNLSPSPASARMLPSSQRSKHGSRRATGRMPFFGDTSIGRLASSLSSISETSLNQDRGAMDDHRATGLLGMSRGRYFRDVVEIRIPNAPGSATSSQQPETGTASSPISSTDSGGSGPDTLPLRTRSRLGYHPPGQPGRRFAWSWLRGRNVRRKMPKLSKKPDREHHSNQSSISTVDTFNHKRPGQASGRPSHQRTYAGGGAPVRPMAPTHLPPAQLIGKVHLARPVTLRGPVNSPSVEGIISGGSVREQSHLSLAVRRNAEISSYSHPVTPRGPRQQPPTARLGTGKMGVSLPVLPNWRDTPDDFLSLSYENLVKESPFHPSTSWSTVPGSEDWVDETVDTLASAPVHQSGSKANWVVVQDSPGPVIRDWDAGTQPSPSPSPSPVRIAQFGQKGLDQGSNGSSQPGKVYEHGKDKERVDNGMDEKNHEPAGGDQTRKGHKYALSKGKSLLSEASKDESDYAVYI
ncbi:hypothetical protein QBC42DRAFT_337591 [Cladorrhinum samala]|uniref:Dystroglycan-type cadherin-like domain-containing protein n=1 Tax=Cladorrhinum samala TaxID=585594 RepID=A0AAV9HRK3_9PEZI|nr:hypothetical protein QBC42DRAFT_337591 [Cladorrhinum samala]